MRKGELLEKALTKMVNAHSGQFDKGGHPYALHPLAVMQNLQTDDEELMCAALLHDTVEDTNTTYAELKEIGFTDRIIEAVRVCTKQRGQTYEEYCQLLFTNLDGMKVKMADLQHNSDIRRLKGIREKDIERMVRYQKLYLELKTRVENWGK